MSEDQARSKAQSPRSYTAIHTTSSQSSSKGYLTIPSTAPRIRSTSPSFIRESSDIAAISFSVPDLGYQDISFPIPERPQQCPFSSKEDSTIRSENTLRLKPQVQDSSAGIAVDIPSLQQVTQPSEFDFPPRRFYSRLLFKSMVDPQEISQVDKQQLITALQQRRVNSLLELRRVERIFAQLGTPDLTEPMTLACKYI